MRVLIHGSGEPKVGTSLLAPEESAVQLVTIPVTADRLDAVTHVRVDHRRLDLDTPLDAGQVVVLRDLDGALRWAIVDRLELDPVATTYHLQLGYPTDETTLRQYDIADTWSPRPRPGLSAADVAELLRQLATARALAGALDRGGTTPA